MRHSPYQERLAELSITELLAEMDDYGIAHYMMHEAAKRIRGLVAASQPAVQADAGSRCACDIPLIYSALATKCERCGLELRTA